MGHKPLRAKSVYKIKQECLLMFRKHIKKIINTKTRATHITKLCGWRVYQAWSRTMRQFTKLYGFRQGYRQKRRCAEARKNNQH